MYKTVDNCACTRLQKIHRAEIFGMKPGDHTVGRWMRGEGALTGAERASSGTASSISAALRASRALTLHRPRIARARSDQAAQHCGASYVRKIQVVRNIATGLLRT
jgi:hypothetical protein